MLYTAIHHLSLEGEHLYPGEVFEAELAEDQEERLLKLGAIRKLPQAVEAPPAEEPPETEEPETPAEAEAPEEPPMVLDAAAGVTAKKRARKEKA
nr:MAG TPA: hypothetical protein [Caudoviricetes sp.]